MKATFGAIVALFLFVSLSYANGVPVRTLRTFMVARKIPFLKLGHRTVLFDPEKVDKALERFEVQEVGRRSCRGDAK